MQKASWDKRTAECPVLRDAGTAYLWLTLDFAEEEKRGRPWGGCGGGLAQGEGACCPTSPPGPVSHYLPSPPQSVHLQEAFLAGLCLPQGEAGAGDSSDRKQPGPEGGQEKVDRTRPDSHPAPSAFRRAT